RDRISRKNTLIHKFESLPQGGFDNRCFFRIELFIMQDEPDPSPPGCNVLYFLTAERLPGIRRIQNIRRLCDSMLRLGSVAVIAIGIIIGDAKDSAINRLLVFLSVVDCRTPV